MNRKAKLAVTGFVAYVTFYMSLGYFLVGDNQEQGYLSYILMMLVFVLITGSCVSYFLYRSYGLNPVSLWNTVKASAIGGALGGLLFAMLAALNPESTYGNPISAYGFKGALIAVGSLLLYFMFFIASAIAASPFMWVASVAVELAMKDENSN